MLIGALIALLAAGGVLGFGSGAVDASSVDCSASTWSVGSPTELNDAITCFNAKTAIGVYTIVVVDDVEYDTPVNTIDNPTGDVALLIDGQGAVLNANGQSPVIVIDNAAVAIQQLTMIGGSGNDGGGITVNAGLLSLDSSAIGENSATNGAGIFNGGADLNIVDTWITSNVASAAGGGLLHVSGGLTIDGSTIDQNTASSAGGIYLAGGTATLTNTTVSGNQADTVGGGLVNETGDVELAYVTITENQAPEGGGLWIAETATATDIAASIVAGNIGDNDTDDFFLDPAASAAALMSGGYNIVGIGNEPGQFSSVGDALEQPAGLNPLADNGGPTKTHLPFIDSPATGHVTAAPASDQSVDQRDQARAGFPKDAGAVELPADICTLTSWTASTFGGLVDAVACFETKTTPGLYRINLGADITYTGLLESIDNANTGVELVIDGRARTLDGNSISHTIRVNNATVSLRNMTVTGARLGGVVNTGTGTVSITDSTITDNNNDFGGGIYNGPDAAMTVTRSTISDNTATSPVVPSGGGVSNEGTLDLIESVVTGNSADTFGGGLANIDGEVTIINSTINLNITQGPGGGIQNSGGNVDITASTIHDNEAGFGGGINNFNVGQVTVTNSTISGNSAAGSAFSSGGGIRNDRGTVDISYSTISGNGAATEGGGVHGESGADTVWIEASIVAGNSAGTFGAGDDVHQDTGGTGRVRSRGYNVIGDVNSALNLSFGQTGDITGAAADLEPLADNGGPTLTRLPMPTSAAVARVTAASTNDQTIDQRGEPRSEFPKDSGAVEIPSLVGVTLCRGLLITVDIGAGQTPTSGDDVILGTAGDDVIEAGDGNDIVCAGDGNDTVLGQNGNDTIDGEGGDDLIIGAAGNDTITGGPGDDTISGNAGADQLRGDEGNDSIFGGSDWDGVFGGPGNDILGGSSGFDAVLGEDGNDVMTGGSDTDQVVAGGEGNDAVNGGGGDDPFVFGGPGDDTVSGNGGNDTIDGGPGNDQVRGGPGNDTVNGDEGDDFVAGNDGVDTCDGGPDTDTAAGNCETVLNVP
jgi:Ca2+-binding RTX toxin-like protein